MHLALRLMAWLLFWTLAIASLATVLLFAYAAWPVLATRAHGGHADLWFFGGSGHAVAAAAIYLAAASAFLLKRRRSPRAGGRRA